MAGCSMLGRSRCGVCNLLSSVEFPSHVQACPDRRRRSRPASHPRRNDQASRLRDQDRPGRRAGPPDPRGPRSRRPSPWSCSISSCPASTAWRCCSASAKAGHPADHRADRARLDRCRHQRHARRRRRLRGQADIARAPRRVDQERAQDRGAAGRDRPHQEEGRGHARVRRPDRARRGHAARHLARPPGRGLQHSGADRRRIRRRQGADRPRHPGRERRAAAPSSPSTAARFPKTWSSASCSATRRAPSPAPSTSASASSRKPTAARCSSTRSANCRSTPR